ncbi:hypothetical protein VQ03_01505 [Methylobacterium tarhaniae]|uniref:Histidine kinase n=1 Tax=Methylobacterium tarhaniae TaxID=1187852 RepID=A0A0J6TGB6_9HYPH|nr:hypothetical protein [Methylobacterium tarhaniae]KMO44753.1 hypothetical protein VQ03_01505 [Methylobacterium tarhaniae]
MRLALAALLLLTALPARADDAAACRDGIAMIKAELAKTQPEPVARTLRKELRVAERELGEREYDECLDAVRDARRALAR